jgi:hypothetical protein
MQLHKLLWTRYPQKQLYINLTARTVKIYIGLPDRWQQQFTFLDKSLLILFTSAFPILLNQPVELTPVIKATIPDANKDWDIGFTLNGKDVPDAMVYKGGFVCNSGYRLNRANVLDFKVNIKRKNEGSGSVANVNIYVMSNPKYRGCTYGLPA